MSNVHQWPLFIIIPYRHTPNNLDPKGWIPWIPNNNKVYWARVKGHSDLLLDMLVDIHPSNYNYHITLSNVHQWLLASHTPNNHDPKDWIPWIPWIPNNNTVHWVKVKGHNDLLFGMLVDIASRNYNCHIGLSNVHHCLLLSLTPNNLYPKGWIPWIPNNNKVYWAKVKGHSDLLLGMLVDIHRGNYNYHIRLSNVYQWLLVSHTPNNRDPKDWIPWIPNNNKVYWAKVKRHRDLLLCMLVDIHPSNYNYHIRLSNVHQWLLVSHTPNNRDPKDWIAWIPWIPNNNNVYWAKVKGHSDLILGMQVDIPPRSYNCHIKFCYLLYICEKWPKLDFRTQGHWAKVKGHSDLITNFAETAY